MRRSGLASLRPGTPVGRLRAALRALCVDVLGKLPSVVRTCGSLLWAYSYEPLDRSAEMHAEHVGSLAYAGESTAPYGH